MGVPRPQARRELMLSVHPWPGSGWAESPLVGVTLSGGDLGFVFRAKSSLGRACGAAAPQERCWWVKLETHHKIMR